jgi:hypothetical protein
MDEIFACLLRAPRAVGAGRGILTVRQEPTHASPHHGGLLLLGGARSAPPLQVQMFIVPGRIQIEFLFENKSLDNMSRDSNRRIVLWMTHPAVLRVPVVLVLDSPVLRT